MDPILHRKAPPHKHQERSANGQVPGKRRGTILQVHDYLQRCQVCSGTRAAPGLYPWLQPPKAGVICHDAVGNADAPCLLERWP